MTEYVIIVAGGTGKRMEIETPKQFLKLGDLPILCHTILAFYHYSKNIHILLVLPSDKKEAWKQLCGKFQFTIPHKVIDGGNSRFQSVKNGLSSIDNKNSLVAIHDGVRPFIDPEIIKTSFLAARELGSGVVAFKPKESIRRTKGDTTVAEDRNNYFSIQTPQTFRTSELIKAYNCDEKSTFTDDASVAENFGIKINLVNGSDENIKITTRTDLIFAEALIQHRKQKSER